MYRPTKGWWIDLFTLWNVSFFPGYIPCSKILFDLTTAFFGFLFISVCTEYRISIFLLLMFYLKTTWLCFHHSSSTAPPPIYRLCAYEWNIIHSVAQDRNQGNSSIPLWSVRCILMNFKKIWHIHPLSPYLQHEPKEVKISLL